MNATRPITIPPPVSFLVAACAALMLVGCYDAIFEEEPEPEAQAPGWDHPDGDTEWDDEIDDEIGETLQEPLRGYVHDPFGLALSDVGVVVEGVHVATTDNGGRFELPDVADGEQLTMGFVKEGYAVSWGSYTAHEGGQNYYSQTLAPVDLVVDFAADQGTDFEVDGTHWFDVPAMSVLDADGEPYEGTVHLEVTVWDRTTPLDEGGEYLASPGEGQGVDALGEDSLLYTYGMFQVQLTSEEGEQLQAGQGVTVQVEVPENSNVQNGEQVPFWEYDGETQTWTEQDQGEIVDLPGGEQIWEFTPTQGLPIRTTTTEEFFVQQSQQASCNPDQIIVNVRQEQDVAGTATGTVTNQQGEPVTGAQVRLISEDQTYMVTTQTNQDGDFSATVPPQVSSPVGPNGRPLFMEVDYEAGGQPFLWRGDPIAPPGASGTVSFGVADLGSMTCVRGSVVDPGGYPVDGVGVATSHGGTATTDAGGNFCMQVPKWQPASVYALPPVDYSEGYQPVRTRPAASVGGSCDTSCPNVVSLTALPATSCVVGVISVGVEPGDGLRVEAFDSRFPTAPVFSTISSNGQYELTIPAGIDVTVRVGAGDLSTANACAQQAVSPQLAGSSCVVMAPMDCGE